MHGIIRFVAGNNAALNRGVMQFGTYGTAVASNAVDGDPSTISCTGNVVQPWWSVDLASAQNVIGVQVTSDDNINFCEYKSTH